MAIVSHFLIWVLVLLLGLIVLVKAADYFNKATEVIGLSFGMSPFIIGVLITAAGTSLPELITSAIAVSQGASDIVPAMVTGSNVTNIFFVIGTIVLVHQKPISLFPEFIAVDLQFLVGSTLFIYIAFFDYTFSLLEGVLCLLGFIIYFFYLLSSTRRAARESSSQSARKKATAKDYLQFFINGLLLFAAAKLVVQSVIYLSEYFQIANSIIAASVMAFGTSLPELVVSMDAIKKNKTDYALGNILGSSIFNSFWVMGFASLFGQIIVSEEVVQIIMPIMIAATILLYTLTRDKMVNMWEALLFLLFYLLFISKIIFF